MRGCANNYRGLRKTVLAAIFFASFSIASPVLAYDAPDPSGPQPRAVIVAVPVNFPPWVIGDASEGVTGLLKDLWTLWESRTGIPVKLQAMPLAEAQEAVLAGEVDIIDALVRTTAREAHFDFSAPHLETHVMLYFSEIIAGVADTRTARGFVVGVVDGDACVDKLLSEGVDTLKKYATHEAMIKAAVRDEIRLFCAQQPVASYFLGKLGKADAFRHSPPIYSPQAHWIVRKGNQDLLRRVSDGFDKITAQERAQIVDRWYGARVEDYELPLYLRYTGYILLALFAGIAALVGWSRILQRQVDLKTASLQGILSDLEAAQKSLDDKNTALRQTLKQAIGALSAAMAHRDMSTAGHERRVCDLAVEIGRDLGLDENRLEGLGLAAVIHDLGQVQTPAEILARPRRLTPEEFDLVKMHAEAGRDILQDIQFPWPIAEIVYQHHENVDGSGYPRGLAGGQLLPEARIIRVADSVEAMLSHRPFRRAVGIDATMGELLAGKGSLYDPEVVDACIRLIERKWQWLAAPEPPKSGKVL